MHDHKMKIWAWMAKTVIFCNNINPTQGNLIIKLLKALVYFLFKTNLHLLMDQPNWWPENSLELHPLHCDWTQMSVLHHIFYSTPHYNEQCINNLSKIHSFKATKLSILIVLHILHLPQFQPNIKNYYSDYPQVYHASAMAKQSLDKYK